MQIQADQLKVAIERPENLETTALGVAYLAGLGQGIWKSIAEVSELNQVRTRFAPGETDDGAYDRWSEQVASMLGRG
jgi:glycerol kinase